jgi:hypothetical protein
MYNGLPLGIQSAYVHVDVQQHKAQGEREVSGRRGGGQDRPSPRLASTAIADLNAEASSVQTSHLTRGPIWRAEEVRTDRFNRALVVATPNKTFSRSSVVQA